VLVRCQLNSTNIQPTPLVFYFNKFFPTFRKWPEIAWNFFFKRPVASSWCFLTMTSIIFLYRIYPPTLPLNFSLCFALHLKQMRKKAKKNYYNAVCSTVIAASNCPETLLSSSVPLHIPGKRKERKKRFNI
jgi:hypothetical protein